MSSSSASSASSSSGAKKTCVVSKSWRRLRKDIFHYVLYSTDPTGEGEHILSLIKLYCFDYKQLPIERLLHVIKPLANGKNSSAGAELLDFSYSEPIDKCLGSERFKTSGGTFRVMKSHETGGLKRSNKWKFMVRIQKFHTQPGWTRGPQIRVLVEKRYEQVHYNSALPENRIDTYFYTPGSRVTYTREGKLSELVGDEKFLYHLRDLIFSGIHKVQKAKFCTKIKSKFAVFHDRTAHYGVLCGTITDGTSNTCTNCWKSGFGSFVSSLACK